MYNEIDLDAIDTTQEPPTEEPARQYYFMAKCREWVREFERKNGRRPFAFTQTFGCQMNARDSEKLAGILAKTGFVETEKEQEADFVIFNTCILTHHSNSFLYHCTAGIIFCRNSIAYFCKNKFMKRKRGFFK